MSPRTESHPHPVDHRAWLLAGAIAILINTGLLDIATSIRLDVGNGILVRALHKLIGAWLQRSGIHAAWQGLGLPMPGSFAFGNGFHMLVGMAMMAVYACAERFIPGKAWRKGLLYALAVYLVNALVLYPWLGAGIAGYRMLTAWGQVYFALAHTLFFVLAALLYDAWRRP